jgi:2-methylisocitrate lyase-like PEP mutase family enzyme
VVMGLKSAALSVADLSALGVKRVSVGSALARAALSGFVDAAREIREKGTFTFAEEILSFAAVSEMVGGTRANGR